MLLRHLVVVLRVAALFLLWCGLRNAVQALDRRTTAALYGVQNPRLSYRRDFRLLHGSTYVKDHDEHVTMIPHAKITTHNVGHLLASFFLLRLLPFTPVH
jgi:hypothetical protein